jgi:hypothetical protein
MGALIGGVMLAFAASAGASRDQREALPCLPLLPCSTPAPTTSTAAPPPPPTAPIVDAGAWYDGHHAARVYASLLVSTDAKRLGFVVFDIDHGRCSDGKSFQTAVELRSSKGAVIGGDGHVSYHHVAGYSAFVTARGQRIHGVQRTDVSATFTRDSASGDVDVSFRAKSIHCSTGAVPFRVYREGTAEAPLHDYKFATGNYRGQLENESTSKQPISMSVFLPWSLITVMRFKWELDCPGRVYDETSTFTFVPIREGTYDFRERQRGVVKLRQGMRADWSYLLFGQGLGTVVSPTGPGSHYIAGGDWGYQVQYTHGGSVLATCSGSATFIANGPPG